MKLLCLACTCFLLGVIACAPRKDMPANQDSTTVDAPSYREKHRPFVHFSPRDKWMNDPNGLFYLDGEYHLFYQYYPDSTVWGPMHWGHAVSTDLMHWEHLPIALFPDSLGYIFSGSAVVDVNNTSGLAAGNSPVVVAIYTYHDPERAKAGKCDFQSQGIAYSNDKGRTWTKYKYNPVLRSPGICDFRDPKVSWSAEAGHWVMTLAVSDHIEFYGSDNLREWKKMSEFGKGEGSHGGVWECPDLLELKDQNGKTKHVLLVSINPGAPNGGSGTQYFVGRFDGKRFVNDTPGKNTGWIDEGTDNYAGVTFSNIPASDGRAILVGWMSNWLYAGQVPTHPWRGATTIPRSLTLHSVKGGYELRSQPVRELAGIVRKSTLEDAAPRDTIIASLFTVPCEITGALDAASFEFAFSNVSKETLLVGFDAASREFYIDRRPFSASTLHDQFGKIIKAPRRSGDAKVPFTMVIDAASIEVFFDNGATAMTAIVFPQELMSELKLYGKSATLAVDSIRVSTLTPVW